MINEANIDIHRVSGKISISVAMPIWDRMQQDDVLCVDIPLLGIKTYAIDENDSDAAVEEAIQLFCKNSEKFGRGLENELKLLGWGFIEQKKGFTSMSYCTSNIVFDQIMQTGEQFVQTLELSL